MHFVNHKVACSPQLVLTMVLSFVVCARAQASGLFLDVAGQPGMIHVHLGQAVTLTCGVGGTPPPIIRWKHNGRYINEENLFEDEALSDIIETGSDGLLLGVTRSRLVIDCFTPAHEGEYICSGGSTEEVIERNFTVRLANTDYLFATDTDSPCLRSKLEQGRAPVITRWTTERLEYEGNNVRLQCRAQGSPRPVITWYGPDKQLVIGNDKHYQVYDNGDLVVQHVTWNDLGLYTCEASNEFGADITTSFLYPTHP